MGGVAEVVGGEVGVVGINGVAAHLFAMRVAVAMVESLVVATVRGLINGAVARLNPNRPLKSTGGDARGGEKATPDAPIFSKQAKLKNTFKMSHPSPSLLGGKGEVSSRVRVAFYCFRGPGRVG